MTCRKTKTTLYRIFALVTVIAVAVAAWMVLSFMSAKKAHADDSTTHDEVFGTGHATATALSEIAEKPASGSYYLTDDIVLTETWELYSDETINLCLHGHTITALKQKVLGVYGSGVINIYDCGGEDNCGAISGGKGVYLYNGGTLNLYGGAIKDADGYAGVSVSGKAVLNMYGGEIKGCSSTSSDSSGVFIGSGGTFNMYGGSIHDNISGSHYGGAGVCVYGGEFHMYGGEIKNNMVDAKSRFFEGNHGGIVYTKKVTEEDLELFYKGAGVCATGGTFTLEGDVVITGNYRTSDLGDKVSNVELDDKHKINISGKLGNNAQIGITAPIGTFTSGYAAAGNTKKPSEFFNSDDSALIVGYDELREEGAITDDDGEYIMVNAVVAQAPVTTVGDTEVTFTLSVTLKNVLTEATKTVPAVVKVELDSPLLGSGKTVSFSYKYNGANGLQTESLSYNVVPNKYYASVSWACSGATESGWNTAKRDYDGTDILTSITARYNGYDGIQKVITGSWDSDDITVKNDNDIAVSEAKEVGVYKFYLAPSADYEYDNPVFTVTIEQGGNQDDGYYQLQRATVIGVKGSPIAGDKSITVILQRKLKHTGNEPDKTDEIDYNITLATALHGGENTVEFEYKYTDIGGGIQTEQLSVAITAAKKTVTVVWYFYNSIAAGNTAQHIYDGADISDKIVAVYDGIDGTKQRVDGASALMVKKDGNGNAVTSLIGTGEYKLSLAASTDYTFENNLFIYTVVQNLSDISDLVYEEDNKTILGVSCEDGFESGTELAVERVDCDSNVVDGRISTALNVKFVKDSEEITPTGSFTVHVLIPEELRNGAEYKIFNLSNGVAREIDYTTEGNYAIFDSDDLECILFVTVKNITPTHSPATDNGVDLTWLWILLTVLSLGAMVLLIVLDLRLNRKIAAVAENAAASQQDAASQNYTKTCPSCGRPNTDNARFCKQCGHKFDQE